MVGLGVGIDYALLMLTRALEYRRAGFGVVEAAAAANRTAGRSVVLAGTTVLVSLLGLRLSGLATFAAFGFATAITVVAVMVTALMLVPALFALTRRWIEPRAVRRARKGKRVRPAALARADRPVGARAERWARKVAGRPLPWLIGAATVMIVLAAPVLDMRTWPGSGGDEVASSPLRQSFDIVAEEFGPGANTPMLFVADREVVSDAEVGAMVAALSDRSDLAQRHPAHGLAGRRDRAGDRRVGAARQRRGHARPDRGPASRAARRCRARRLLGDVQRHRRHPRHPDLAGDRASSSASRCCC